MTSDSFHSRPISDASDASRRGAPSDDDATAAFASAPEARNDAPESNGGEPSTAEFAPPDDAFFSFDDASTRTSAPPFGAENDEVNKRLEDERTVVSRTPPVEPERKSETTESFGDADAAFGGDGGDGGALKPGARFGHFVVTKYIGGGGMGRVYEGRDTALDRKVAIKVLPRQRAQDVGTVARFLNEAKSAARLNHEHIAQVYFCGEQNGVPFIAFEYVYGVNLRDYVRERGVLELDEAIGYVLQAADALAHAAAHGVTHRDVKPSNIIVTPQKRAKLIDMGLARLLKSDLVDDDLTESGVTLGTFDYISPEQARDPRDADVRSDIYSLGCTFYYMLVGTPPFPEGTMLQKLLQHQGDEPPDVREANPAIPIEVAAVVKKMMRKAPDDRYQTPESLILDLREIAEMIGLRLSGRGFADLVAEERRGVPTTPRAPAAIVCAVFFAFVAVLYWRPGSETPTLPVVETPIAPIASTSDSNAETRAAEKGSASSSAATDGANGALGGETETSATLSATDDGETFSAAEIDALYGEARASVVDVPPLYVDDGAEWRRSFLSGATTSDDAKRVAWGWRSERRVAASADWNGVLATASANANDGSGAPSVQFFATAYSFLGTSTNASATGVRTEVASANATRTVDRVGDGSQTFATLQAALATGSGGADERPIRVELKFDGALATPPISLVGRKVEIVAADGFRPTLVFNPRNVATGGWDERMFFLNASELTLRGVAIDFTVPTQDVVASKWSVFEATGPTVLTLIDSSATVCNASGEAFSAPLHSNVAIFRSTFETRTFDELESGVGEPERGAPSIRLDGVFARGEAALFATNGVGDSLEARRCGFNVSGAIFWANEAERTGASAPSDGGERSTLNFDRVVVVGRSALASLNERGDVGELTPLDASLTNSAIWLGGAPLATATVREQETNPATVAWNLDGSLLLDAEPALRTRTRQTAATRDWPLAFDAPPNASAKLNDLSPDAVARLLETPPHRFASTDFGRWILTPAQTSSALDSATRKTVEEIKASVVDGTPVSEARDAAF